MTQEQQILRTHNLIIEATNQLADAGVHPLAICEGILAAAVNLHQPVMGKANLVKYLHDSSNLITD
jgi:hypothetical protein